MGWVWKDEPDDAVDVTAGEGDRCSTSKVVRSNCKTEEIEPGKFVRKCEKTEEVLRECVGRPVEVLQSNKEYTEEDVTEQMLKGNFSSGSHGEGSFEFPGLRSDLEAIEREFFGGVNRFFDAAEEMRKSFFDAFGDFYGRESSSLPSPRRGIPVEDHPQKKASPKRDESGRIDLSGLAKDV
ncbi:fra a 1-associated protein [Hibiscus syriacus]|uniref:fra a 1-associated protein n=1 Tax=Hibiscus syriacus TaxID=106335 RepID=UPI0019203EBC|nr:fra a 1-associated protein [Hibiscus syriacus]